MANEEAAQVPQDGGQPRSVITLIRQIQNGHLSPENLSADDRRLCVSHLTAEGVSIAEAAEILGVAERTIARDRKTIRQSNAVEQSPQLAKEIVGRLMLEADTVISHLRRIAREKETAPADKIAAERSVWEVTTGLVKLLQSLGYLPTAAQQLSARVSLGLDEGLNVNAMLTEVERLQAIQMDTGSQDESAGTSLARIRESIQRISIEGKQPKDQTSTEEATDEH